MARRFLARAAASLLVVVMLVVAAFWLRGRIARDRTFPIAATTVIVPNGATGHDIALLLAHDKVVSSALLFELLARFKGERSQMKAGEFRFSAHQTLAEVLHQVVAGGQQVAAWVTIPEGYTAREIAATLARTGLGGDAKFVKIFTSESLDLGAGTKTVNLEGYLFPDTYLVPLDDTPQQVANIMTGRFREMLPSGAAPRAKALGLTVPQVVVLASLVEREAKADDERPLMAGVYYNRLRRKMPLQVDATIEYTFAHHKDVITYADLARNSPYNTYEHIGLPPTPIANPGRPSLLAAFYPQASDDLYYVYKGNGHHAFSRTLAEHNANVARYLH
ncbi:MAG: endolytic transglycosylase MltG [Candidatus Eremiobacteraeota bacterium]|nr:endolytic transglycosylase MltG [Candidatus Eremiobacteraeota bacterium]